MSMPYCIYVVSYAMKFPVKFHMIAYLFQNSVIEELL